MGGGGEEEQRDDQEPVKFVDVTRARVRTSSSEMTTVRGEAHEEEASERRGGTASITWKSCQASSPPNRWSVAQRRIAGALPEGATPPAGSQ
jgi:hypothetical protein